MCGSTEHRLHVVSSIRRPPSTVSSHPFSFPSLLRPPPFLLADTTLVSVSRCYVKKFLMDISMTTSEIECIVIHLCCFFCEFPVLILRSVFLSWSLYIDRPLQINWAYQVLPILHVSGIISQPVLCCLDL